MNVIRTEAFVLPSFLASYLINGDDTGLRSDEVNALHDFMAQHDLEACLSCSDEDFPCSVHDYTSVVDYGCDCLIYVFRVKQ